MNQIKDLKIHIKHNTTAIINFMNVKKLIIMILSSSCKFMNTTAKYATYANVEIS